MSVVACAVLREFHRPSQESCARSEETRLKVVKKKKPDARTPELVETDIARAEQRLNEISQQMGTAGSRPRRRPLIALNDEYQQTEALLRTLYEEWDRVTQEPAPASS